MSKYTIVSIRGHFWLIYKHDGKEKAVFSVLFAKVSAFFFKSIFLRVEMETEREINLINTNKIIQFKLSDGWLDKLKN